MEKSNIISEKRKRENDLKGLEEETPNFVFCKNLVEDSFMDLGTDNTFAIFNTFNNTFCLIYSNRSKSIISYDIIDNKKKIEIKNAHKNYITSFEHISDTEKKRDLLISASAKENNLKLWNVDNFDCLHEFKKNNNNKLLNLFCFLFNDNSIYIVRSGNKDFPIQVYDMNENKIKDIEGSNHKINVLSAYNNKARNKTYILAINDKIIKAYDYSLNELYNEYSSNVKERINSICIDENKLIGLCYGGYILIWDFLNSILLEEIRPYKSPLYGIFLLNNDNLCFGHKKNIKIINLKSKKISTLNHSHDKEVIAINKINHPIYGECLVSQGDQQDKIKLWIKEKKFKIFQISTKNIKRLVLEK